MDWDLKVKCLDTFVFLLFTSQDFNLWTLMESCELLYCFNQMFELSF